MKDVTKRIKKVSGGDFTNNKPVKRKDELGQIAVSLSGMTESIRSLIVQVKEVMETVTEVTALVGQNTETLIESDIYKATIKKATEDEDEE